MKKAAVIAMALMVSITAFAQRDTIKVREVGLVFSSLNSFGLCYKGGNENTLFRITALTSTGANSSTNYNTLNEGGDTDAVPASPSSSFSAGLNFGIEKRKHINNKFYFYYGLVLINSYSESKSNTSTPASGQIGYFINNTYYAQAYIVNNNAQSNSWTINSGLGIVVGVAYKLSRSFIIEAELIPSVTYNYSEIKTSATSYNVTFVTHPNAPNTQYEAPVASNTDKITKGISYSALNNNAAITIAYRIK